MTRRKAQLAAYAVAAANGNWAALGLLMDIAEGNSEDVPSVIVKYEDKPRR